MKKISFLILFLSFLFIGLTGCDDKAKPTPDTNTEYTVTFDAGTGGTLTSAATVKVKSGEKVAKPTDPTREGFAFVEWRKTGATTAFPFATETITADITLTAQWVMATTPTFTVTFAGEGGTTSTQTVPDGGMAKRPTPDPTREGFTFVEWRKTGANTAFPFTTETITADITLTAQWERDFRMLTEIDTPSSLLRQWMQRATTQAHISNAYSVFNGGTRLNDIISLYINDTPTLEVRIFPSDPMISLQAGIPSTSEVRRSIGSTNLFGTDKTADGYAVSEDTLFITQNQATLAIMVINSTEKAIFVKAGDAPGLLLYSDNDADIDVEDWVTRADLAAGAHTYTGASSTVLNGSGEPVPSTLGVGSTLKFFVNTARNRVDSVQFTQSNTSADSISGIISGTIVIDSDLSDTGTSTKWPRKSNSPKVIIYNALSETVPYNSLVFGHTIGLTRQPDLVRIEVLSRGGDLKVIFTSGRNATTPAEEVTVTYRRPSSN